MPRRGKHEVQVWMFRAAGLLFTLFFIVSLLNGEAPSALVRPAAALSCSLPSRFDVYPASGNLAPRNTRVVVVAAPSQGMPGWKGHNPPRIALLADGDGRGEVPSSTEETASGDLTTIVLAPQVLLQENRAFSVLAGGEPIGHFRTSAEIDREPPRWDGVNEIGAQWCHADEPINPGCVGIGYASLVIEPAVDPGHSSSPPLYALFADQSRTPFLYLRSHESRLFLGGRTACRDSNIDWGAVRFDLTIRAADMAGNFSAPHRYRIEVGVDGVSHPRARPPWLPIGAAVVSVLLAAYSYATHRHRRARARLLEHDASKRTEAL